MVCVNIIGLYGISKSINVFFVSAKIVAGFLYYAVLCVNTLYPNNSDIHHFSGHSTVNDNVLAVDKVVFLVAQKKAHTGNVVRKPYSAGWMLPVVSFGERFVMIIFDPARRNGIDCDVILA